MRDVFLQRSNVLRRALLCVYIGCGRGNDSMENETAPANNAAAPKKHRRAAVQRPRLRLKIGRSRLASGFV